VLGSLRELVDMFLGKLRQPVLVPEGVVLRAPMVETTKYRRKTRSLVGCACMEAFIAKVSGVV
jgi:hypothetical protein